MVVVGPGTVVAMGITIGSHRSGFVSDHAVLQCAAPIVCAPLPESPGRDPPSSLLLASQGCCSLTSLAGEIEKSVQCFGCVGADTQLGQGKDESV